MIDCQMILCATQVSHDLGYKWRVRLHSLPNAETFYLGIGMESVSNPNVATKPARMPLANPYSREAAAELCPCPRAARDNVEQSRL